MMKVSTCMNPMDTALGVFGCMLGYTRISDEMKDTELVNLITRLSEQEAMPMVATRALSTRRHSCTRFSVNVIRTRSCRIPRSVPQPIPRVRLHRASAPRCTLTITPCCPHTVPPG